MIRGVSSGWAPLRITAVTAAVMLNGSSSPGNMTLRPTIVPLTLLPQRIPAANSCSVGKGSPCAGQHRSKIGRVVAKATGSRAGLLGILRHVLRLVSLSPVHLPVLFTSSTAVYLGEKAP